MIELGEALAIVRAHRPTFEPVGVPLMQARGHVLAQNYSSPFDLPMFDNSAMDGYAVGGPEGPWELVGEVAAGQTPQSALKPCEAVRIFTGSPVPERTYGVIPQEEAEVRQGLLLGQVRRSGHIRFRSEEIQAGTEVAAQGDALDPTRIAALASVGLDYVNCHKLPQIALISTGNEVVEPGTPLLAGQIYNSNAAAVQSTAEWWGADCLSLHARDTTQQLTSAFDQACKSCDLIVTTGGVSVGSHDHVLEVVEAQGFEVKFHGVRVKPGKPIGFGIRTDRKAWFGLPGNPFSTWVGLLVFVAAYLGRELKMQRRPMAHDLERKAGREEFYPAQLDDLGAVTVRQTVGSHANLALVDADGLARVDADSERLSAGQVVEFLSLPWRHA